MSTRRESNEILDRINQHPSTAAVPGTPRRAEKAELLHRLLSELGDSSHGIDSRPRVAGDQHASCGRGFLFGCWEQARRLGTSEAEILKAYPTQRAEDLTNAWGYVRTH